MTIPADIAAHKPIAGAPEGKTPFELFPLIKSLVEERDLCQRAVSTRDEPTTGRPLRRGDHARYITQLEDATKKLEATMEVYKTLYGQEAAAQVAELVKL